MMMFDRKNTMTSLLQKRKAGGGEMTVGPTPMKEENVRTEDGEPDMHHLAAQDVMDAFHSKSADKLKTSMGNFIDLHMGKSAEPEPDDE